MAPEQLPANTATKRAPIRSFVLRKGRLTPAQRRAIETFWPLYGIDFVAAPVDFIKYFGRTAPLVLEIGFGNGDALLEMAQAEPESDFVGIEVHKPGVGAVLGKIAAAGLANVCIISEDAVVVLEHMITDAELSGIRLFFPDPWPKKRHHKRRIVQPGFLRLVATKMAAGGSLHLATDWQDYAEQMLEVLDCNPDFANSESSGGFIERPAWRPLTHFEQRGARLGHGVWDILYTRC